MPPDTVEQLTLLQQLQNKRDEGVNALGTLVDRRTEARTEFEQRSNGDEPTDEQRGVFTAAEEEFEREFNRRDAEIRVVRGGEQVFKGKLASLKRFKDDAREVTNGMECGMGIAGFSDIQVGDQIEAFVMERMAAELTAGKPVPVHA